VRKLDSGCWEWTGSRNEKGYGRFNAGGHSPIGAHRYAWQLAYGPVPPGRMVLHECDNPPCVNAAHLFLGTAADNMTDMVAKGRSCRRDECRAGHAMSGDNILIRKGGGRSCRECSRIRSRNWYRANRAVSRP